MNNTMSDSIDFTLLNIQVPEQIKNYSIEKQREYILQYNFLASSKSFDKSIFPFTAPYIEYNNFGIQKIVNYYSNNYNMMKNYHIII